VVGRRLFGTDGIRGVAGEFLDYRFIRLTLCYVLQLLCRLGLMKLLMLILGG